MASKIDFTKKTKLQIQNEKSEGQKEEVLNILKRSVGQGQNKTFRFRAIDQERLTGMLQKANESSDTTILKESDIIRALLALGEGLKGEEIIGFIRKSF